MDKVCSSCGRTISSHSKKYPKGLCQSCYKYFKKGGKVHLRPIAGQVKYDDEGKLVCHICGKSYVKLMAHVAQVHGMEEKEYKRVYKLYKGKGLISTEHKKVLQKNVENHKEVVINQNLLNKGKGTRWDKGSKGRTKDQIPLQHYNKLRGIL